MDAELTTQFQGRNISEIREELETSALRSHINFLGATQA